MQIITWLLVVVGWLVLSDQQESRDFSKHVSQRLSELRKDLSLVEVLAKTHHTGSFDLSSVQQIVGMLGSLSDELAYLRKERIVGMSTANLVADFRRAVTGNNMDQSSYSAVGLSSQLVIEILTSRQVLDRELLISSHAVMRSRRSISKSLLSKLGL